MKTDPVYPLSGRRVWVAGETGLAGRGIVRALLSRGDVELLSAPRTALDLTVQADTFGWLEANRPDIVFMAAGLVGGIGYNARYPADFIRDNLSMAQNVIDGAHRAGVQTLVYLGSSCIYPKFADQPMREEAIMTGPLEETNEAYAMAKLAGLALCRFYTAQYGRRYLSVLPTNLYGPYDRFGEARAHVIAALMERFDNAARAGVQDVRLWGTGTPLREFLHTDDLASALLCLAEHYDGDAPVNIGSGEELPIATLASLMAALCGYKGRVLFDESQPDGTPRKLLDSSRIRALGWQPRIPLKQGLWDMYEWYNETHRAEEMTTQTLSKRLSA